MKKWMLLVLSAWLIVFCACSKGSESEKRPSVQMASCAIMEYAGEKDSGYKLITSEIASLYTFDSLILKESSVVYDGDWIYRIVFNPEAYVKNGTEIVIEFKQQSVSINGEEYIADTGVDYGDILAWAENKYEFFDYELVKIP